MKNCSSILKAFDRLVLRMPQVLYYDFLIFSNEAMLDWTQAVFINTNVAKAESLELSRSK